MESKKIKWLLLSVLSLVWGSSFILMKKGLLALTAVELGALRIIFAALFLLLVGFRSLQKIENHQWKYLVLTAFFGTFFPVFLFAYAQQNHINSSISAIINALTPLNTLLIGVCFLGTIAKKQQWIGVLLGFLGCFLLVAQQSSSSGNNWYAGLVILASVCYAINVNLIKRYLSGIPPLAITTANFLFLLLPALLLLYNTSFSEIYQQPKVHDALVYVAILGIVGTGLANILFFRLIQISSPLFASSVTYLIPIVAIFWGVLDNESLNFMQQIGAVIVLLGVYISNKN